MIIVHAGPEALRRFRIGKEVYPVASKRHGMITRQAYTYVVSVVYRDGSSAYEHIVLGKRNDKEALAKALRIPRVKRAELRSLYRDIYALLPSVFYKTADIIQRESVYID